MQEKELLKKSGISTIITLLGLSVFWFLFSIQTSFGYSGTGTTQDLKSGSRFNGDLLAQPLNGSVTIYFGTQSTQGTGTVGYIGTNTAGLPFLRYSFLSGSSSMNFNGFGAVYIDSVAIPSAGSLTGKIDAVGGVGTGNTFNNPTLAGLGTITASFGANGLVISPAEYACVNNATGELQSQITTATGSITNHTHTGSDGTTQISHNNVTGTGSTSHTTIDSFIASKASASGLASLDANTLVVQNPASGTSTPGVSKTVMSDGTGKILDGWLSNNITKLGTPTTDNISEGSTNKYYTDARVNSAVGSLSVNTLNDVNIVFNENDFVKIVGGQLVAGSSTATVSFPEVTGSASASQLPLISGLLGSATSAQLPTVFKLYGTTTEQAAGAFGQLYVQSSAANEAVDAYTELLLHMDSPGTSTGFVDYSASAHTVTANGAAIGTSTSIHSGGSYLGNGTDSYLSIANHVDFTFPGDLTIDGVVQWITVPTNPRTLFHTSATDFHGVSLIMDNATTIRLLFALTDGSNWDINTTATIPAMATGTPYHFAVVRNGTTVRAYLGGIQYIAGTSSATPSNTSIVMIGAGNTAGSPERWIDGYMDEFRVSKGIARWTGNFTPPTASYGAVYTQYSAKYKDPVNGNTVLEIVTTGTTTTEASYIYCNATTTVFGLGTNTAIAATVTAYSGWFDGAVRATAFNVASTEKIKDNIKDIKIKPDLLDAEGMAKQNYIAGAKSTWIAENQADYTTVVNEAGSGSVAVVDTDSMESDYSNHIELAWAADLNQDTYTENIQKTHEKGFWQMFDSVTPKSWNPKDRPTLTRRGFVVEEMPPFVRGDDGQSMDPMALIAYISVVQQTLKADTIFALSTLKELIMTGTVTQQKIDYVNDRLEVLNP